MPIKKFLATFCAWGYYKLTGTQITEVRHHRLTQEIYFHFLSQLPTTHVTTATTREQVAYQLGAAHAARILEKGFVV